MKQLSDEIEDLLSPVVGQGLAQSLVSLQCRKMDILPAALTYNNISIFAELFFHPLKIFIGEDIAREITEKIREIADKEKTGSDIPEY